METDHSTGFGTGRSRLATTRRLLGALLGRALLLRAPRLAARLPRGAGLPRAAPCRFRRAASALLRGSLRGALAGACRLLRRFWRALLHRPPARRSGGDRRLLARC